MSIRERISDRITVFTKFWNVVCEMNLGSMTGGYYDQFMLERISASYAAYEQARVAYKEKWSKKIG